MLCVSSPSHAELVSASTVRQSKPPRLDGWTLKQVQGDGMVFLLEKLD